MLFAATIQILQHGTIECLLLTDVHCLQGILVRAMIQTRRFLTMN